MQIFHNYIRPHEALEGKTPSEASGIKVEGLDKWQTIIQNAKAEKLAETKTFNFRSRSTSISVRSKGIEKIK